MARELIETTVHWGIILEGRKKQRREETFAGMAIEDVVLLVATECSRAGGRLGWLSITCRYAKENDGPDSNTR